MSQQRSAPHNGGSGHPVARPASLRPGTRRIGGNEYTIHAPIDQYSLVVCSCWLTSMSCGPSSRCRGDSAQKHIDLMLTGILQEWNLVAVQNVPIQFHLLDAAIDTCRILHTN